MSQQTTTRSFDDLARALAEGSISRRRALKLFAGTALATLISSRALADDECVRVCHVPFDGVTEECDFANAQTRCVSRRERRRHLENHPCDCRGRCANCLTTCLPNGGSCTANSDCCSGLLCDTNGKCADVGCSGIEEVCAGAVRCGANTACSCFNTTEGSHACVVESDSCEGLQICQSSNDCPAGTACVVTCCTDTVCAPLCGTTTSAALQAESGGGNPARKPTL